MRNAIKSLAAVSASISVAFAGVPVQAQDGRAEASFNAAMQGKTVAEPTAADADSPEAIKERALRELNRIPIPAPATPVAPELRGNTAAIVASVLAQHKLACTIAEARPIMSGKSNYHGKSVDADFVEVACQNAVGYVLIKHRGKDTSQFVECIEAAAKEPKCALPANARPELTLARHLGPRSATCSPSGAAFVGLAPNGRIYEVKCAQGDGLIVVAPRPGATGPATTVLTCFSQIGTPNACTLTTPTESTAAVTALAAQSGKTCAPTGQRYMAGRSGGGGYYEFACASGTGLVVLTKADGSVEMGASCAQAVNIAGGCKLTAKP